MTEPKVVRWRIDGLHHPDSNGNFVSYSDYEAKSQEVMDLCGTVRGLEADRDRLAARVEELEVALEATQHAVQVVAAKKDRFKAEGKALLAENTRLRARVKELEMSLGAATQAGVNLGAENTRLRKVVSGVALGVRRHDFDADEGIDKLERALKETSDE